VNFYPIINLEGQKLTSNPSSKATIKEHSLGGSRLSRINMSNDADVSSVFQAMILI